MCSSTLLFKEMLQKSVAVPYYLIFMLLETV
jgi:hypothetical protein